jgi:hypothetical protein
MMDDFYSQDMSNEFSFDQPLDQFMSWQSIDDYEEEKSNHSFMLDDPEEFSQDFF